MPIKEEIRPEEFVFCHKMSLTKRFICFSGCGLFYSFVFQVCNFYIEYVSLYWNHYEHFCWKINWLLQVTVHNWIILWSTNAVCKFFSIWPNSPALNGRIIPIKCVIKKTYYFFIWIQWKVVVVYVYLHFTKFHWIQMKNKDFFNDTFNGWSIR